ncbi:MAG: DUF2079 domain-containing protein [Vulcanimicrobiaceae bacterium]
MRDRVVWALTALYAALFTGLGILRYQTHRNFVDFGIFAQTSASAFGCFCNAVEGSHYAFHFSPILYLAGAAVWLVRSPFTMIALQAIAGALVIPPVAGIVARHGDRALSRLAGVVVFLYPALGGAIFTDFHENGFAPAAVAWMLWAFDGGYFVTSTVAAAIALCVKEDQALFLAVAGGFGAWRYRGKAAGRYALGIGIAGLLIFTLFFAYIQPHATANPHWAPTRFYAWTSADLRGLVPRGFLERAGFFALAFGPLLFLPFRSRMMWLAAAPLAEVLLSRMSTTYTLGTHYAGAWAGYVLVAFAFAITGMQTRRARAFLWSCVALCAVEYAVANPLHPGLNLHPVAARDVALERVLHELPPDMSIATQEEAYTHLALRDPYARPLPDDPARITHACFILLDRDYPDSPRLVEYGSTVETLVRDGVYSSALHSGGIDLYRRSGACR